MDGVQIILLAVVQGITEFLPISSSGHLVIFSELFQFEFQDVFYDVTLHFATLCAVVLYFARLWYREWRSLSSQNLFNWKIYRAYGVALVLGTIPVFVVAYFLLTYIDFFRTLVTVAIALIVSGILLFGADYLARKGKSFVIPLEWRGLVVGLFQIISLIPGISRSGITISAGRLFGFSRTEATRFSFLLSIPVIFAAFVYLLYTLESVLISSPGILFIAGIVSFCIAYATIHWFLKFVEKVGFAPFYIYQICLGLVLLLTVL